MASLRHGILRRDIPWYAILSRRRLRRRDIFSGPSCATSLATRLGDRAEWPCLLQQQLIGPGGDLRGPIRRPEMTTHRRPPHTVLLPHTPSERGTPNAVLCPHPSSTIHCSPSTVYCSRFTVQCSQSTPSHPLSSAHGSPIIEHCMPDDVQSRGNKLWVTRRAGVHLDLPLPQRLRNWLAD